IDLSRYAAPALPGNRGLLWRVAWHLVSALLFQGPLVLPSRCKAALLRAFGARVGRGLVIKPRVTIKYPWFLTLGDHVWLGEGVWIDNHTGVHIGCHVCISQGAYLFTGNHDWNDPGFRFFCHPITIEDGVWVAAKAVICPGSVLARLSVIGAGVVWRGRTVPAGVYADGALPGAPLRRSACPPRARCRPASPTSTVAPRRPPAPRGSPARRSGSPAPGSARSRPISRSCCAAS